MLEHHRKHHQLDEELYRRVAELDALQLTLLDIFKPHDLTELLHTIVERAVNLLKANGGGLYLCNPDKREVVCVVSFNTKADHRGTVLKYGEGAAGYVASKGKAIIIDDYGSWPGRAPIFEQSQSFTAVLSAPLIWQ
ncbi:MAG: GAF domain-containing protein [Spirochaetaceae bacterium]|nr:MAG: GAF domain-containing protein [Spirochaetaceae bacterium]